MTKDKTVTMSRELALFESILGKNPEAYLHEPFYQVTESEVLEFSRQIAAPVVERQYKQYTTQPAESLAGMAARQLKDEGRWIEIRDANALEFPDMAPHDYYPVGSVIRIPCVSPPAPVAVPVEIHQQLIEMRQQYERANFVALGKLLSACIYKVKELNQ